MDVSYQDVSIPIIIISITFCLTLAEIWQGGILGTYMQLKSWWALSEDQCWSRMVGSSGTGEHAGTFYLTYVTTQYNIERLTVIQTLNKNIICNQNNSFKYTLEIVCIITGSSTVVIIQKHYLETNIKYFKMRNHPFPNKIK